MCHLPSFQVVIYLFALDLVSTFYTSCSGKRAVALNQLLGKYTGVSLKIINVLREVGEKDTLVL